MQDAAFARDEVPAGQIWHPDCPALGATVPAGHAMHAEEALERVSLLYVPGGHAEHELEPNNALKDPAGHDVHASSDVDELFGLKVPGGHREQLTGDVAPTFTLNEPPGH